MATELSLNYSIPDLLVDKVKLCSPYQNFNARGNPTSWGVDMDFNEMQLSKTLKSSDFYLLKGKIEDTMRSWEEKYKRYLDKKHKESRSSSVEEMNQEAKESIDELNGILAHTLTINDVVDWDAIKVKGAFRIKPDALFVNDKKPDFNIKYNSSGQPISFEAVSPPEKPTLEKVKSEYGLFSKLFRGKFVKVDFEKRTEQWHIKVDQNSKENAIREAEYKKVVDIFESKNKSYEEEKQRENTALEDIKARYNDADPKAVEEYCDLVLNTSKYPDYFPKNWNLEYRPENHMVVLDYNLPSPELLPSVKSYTYVKSRDKVTKKLLAAAESKKLYEQVIYQVCIRTIHELIEADVVNSIAAVAFNAVVTNINAATGIKETKIIMSVLADKNQFNAFDLSKVDPKATFKHLKGVAAVTLIDLTPIPPVISMDKSDKRFIDGKAVAAQLDKSVNIAAMNWDDFEHLVRELFEKEFAVNGGEVKVTQASADGGVDAVAFDPEPIRGGKIVIQAKRYTNTVGVAAVRELYGTVMNEGAIKGILVTTSDYGKDSYEFAKDKPITLLNGNNLLSLLEKHGHKARINIAEAKKMQT